MKSNTKLELEKNKRTKKEGTAAVWKQCLEP